jgi:hypothetical protein
MYCCKCQNNDIAEIKPIEILAMSTAIAPD